MSAVPRRRASFVHNGAMAKESRDLQALRAYAKERSSVEPITRGRTLQTAGGFAVFLMGLVGAWAIGTYWTWWLVGLGFVLGAGISGSILSSMVSAVRRPRTEEEKVAVQVHGLLKSLGNMGKQKVRTNVDPVAGQILEACVIHRNRIIASLDSVAWTTRAVNEPWKSVRDQARIAAEAAMDEALILCSPFIGAGRGVKDEEEWGKVITDFLDKGVGAAIRRVDKILAPKKPLDISQVPSQLRPAFDVASKLQSLADEVDATSEAAAAETSTAGATLDQALSNLRAIQQAEKELDESLQQRLT